MVKGREAKLAALPFVVGGFGQLDVAEHLLISQLYFASLTCRRTLEDIESGIGGQLHLSDVLSIHVSVLVDAPTARRSKCWHEHTRHVSTPVFRFTQGSSQQTSMSMTTFSELGHLLFIFDFIRTRPYSFQANLDNVAIL